MKLTTASNSFVNRTASNSFVNRRGVKIKRKKKKKIGKKTLYKPSI